MKTHKTRSLLAGLPPRELLASFGLPPDALDQMMDNDQMASRALVLTRGAATLGLRLTSGAKFDRDKLNKIDDPSLASVGNKLIATLQEHLPSGNDTVSPSELNDWIRDNIPDATVTNFDAANLFDKLYIEFFGAKIDVLTDVIHGNLRASDIITTPTPSPRPTPTDDPMKDPVGPSLQQERNTLQEGQRLSRQPGDNHRSPDEMAPHDTNAKTEDGEANTKDTDGFPSPQADALDPSHPTTSFTGLKVADVTDSARPGGAAAPPLPSFPSFTVNDHQRNGGDMDDTSLPKLGNEPTSPKPAPSKPSSHPDQHVTDASGQVFGQHSPKGPQAPKDSDRKRSRETMEFFSDFFKMQGHGFQGLIEATRQGDVARNIMDNKAKSKFRYCDLGKLITTLETSPEILSFLRAVVTERASLDPALPAAQLERKDKTIQLHVIDSINKELAGGAQCKKGIHVLWRSLATGTVNVPLLPPGLTEVGQLINDVHGTLLQRLIDHLLSTCLPQQMPDANTSMALPVKKVALSTLDANWKAIFANPDNAGDWACGFDTKQADPLGVRSIPDLHQWLRYWLTAFYMAGLIDSEKTVSILMERFIAEIRDLQTVDHVADPLVIRSKVIMPIFEQFLSLYRNENSGYFWNAEPWTDYSAEPANRLGAPS